MKIYPILNMTEVKEKDIDSIEKLPLLSLTI